MLRFFAVHFYFYFVKSFNPVNLSLSWSPPHTPSVVSLSLPVIIIAVAEAIILLTVIFLRKRILIAIALIQEASRSEVTSRCL